MARGTLGAVAFPRKLLNDGEACVVDLRPHWWFLAEPTGALVGAILIGLAVINEGGEGTAWDVAEIAAAGLVLFCLGWFVTRYLRWVTTNFVVTTDRLIYRSGVIAKQGIEIPLERVNTVFFNQTMFERMLGAGDLRIESGGETGSQSFADIRKPSLVQNEIYRQMESNENRKFDRIGAGRGGADRSGASIPDQIEALDELRKRGVISEHEFATKKAQLLERM